MANHKDTIERECTSCNATGLYFGIAERDGAAIVCHTCKGTGCERVVIEWKDFERRKKTTKARHVYQVNVGIILGGPNLEDFGGMSYKDWTNGVKFKVGMENRKYTCPAWWYQSADYKKKPDWKECWSASSFSSCKSFPTKNKCWERWDKEFGDKK